MVQSDLAAASPFMYDDAVEMRREYEGMTKLSVGNWVYRLSLAISIRFGILLSMIQLRMYWWQMDGGGGGESAHVKGRAL